ncbi:MAG: NAD(P) transhydrogenase subunit alpha [Phycisphaera sp.]|nr:NAD(P) transhydrogenase subunit alpha [Phycisphaera sp.]
MGIIALLTIFVLAMYLGKEIITKVPPTLHTPLMSGSNAISGITIVGAILAAHADAPAWSSTLAFLAIVTANINVFGGYLVTHRMLSMFKKKG